MHKPFGAQGEIRHFPYKDLHETFYNQIGIALKIHDGVLSVGVEDEADLEAAKDLAHSYLAAWSVRQQIQTSVDFNHTWQTDFGGTKNHRLAFREKVKLGERLQVRTTTQQVTLHGTASGVTRHRHESASFTHDAAMVHKAHKYPALKDALLSYNEESVDDARPLYGVYKALEVMIAYLQTTGNATEKEAREKLAGWVGQPRSYVDDVMQTTQVKRHHTTAATRKLSDVECRQRAKILIDAFARSLS